jgi:hypothetical protein
VVGLNFFSRAIPSVSTKILTLRRTSLIAWRRSANENISRASFSWKRVDFRRKLSRVFHRKVSHLFVLQVSSDRG